MRLILMLAVLMGIGCNQSADELTIVGLKTELDNETKKASIIIEQLRTVLNDTKTVLNDAKAEALVAKETRLNDHLEFQRIMKEANAKIEQRNAKIEQEMKNIEYRVLSLNRFDSIIEKTSKYGKKQMDLSVSKAESRLDDLVDEIHDLYIEKLKYYIKQLEKREKQLKEK